MSKQRNPYDLFDQGMNPEFYPDTEVTADVWRLMQPAERGCVFCRRSRDQGTRLILSVTAERSVCHECIDELAAMRRGPDEHQRWRNERDAQQRRAIGSNPYPELPPDQRKPLAPPPPRKTF